MPSRSCQCIQYFRASRRSRTRHTNQPDQSTQPTRASQLPTQGGLVCLVILGYLGGGVVSLVGEAEEVSPPALVIVVLAPPLLSLMTYPCYIS